jgi:hypothetical protein
MDNPVRNAFEVLYGTLVPFNERKQESFCRVCRYHDPLGPDGNRLHDEACPLMELHRAIHVNIDAPELEHEVNP